MQFSEMKGTLDDLGEMKIPLKLDAKPICQRPYRLNLRYKDCVKAEIDRMLNVGLIEPVEESEWIIPMVVQDKKTSEIHIFFNLRNLNDACVHDLFPTPFIDEVLEGVGSQEIYSFIDGFSGYHQIRIAKEDDHKTTFVIEWGYFQYTVMPFGLKKAPAVFSHIVVTVFKYFIQKFLQVYMDDLTVYGLIRDHLDNL